MKKVFSDFNDAGFSLIEVLVALFIVSVVITSVPSIIGMTSKLVIDSNNEKRNIETLICHVLYLFRMTLYFAHRTMMDSCQHHLEQLIRRICLCPDC